MTAPAGWPRIAAASLRALLAEIDAGRIDATDAEHAYLSGAADAAARLTETTEVDADATPEPP